MPKGYKAVARNVDNPKPVKGFESCQTRWTEGGVCKVWDNRTLYEKPAVNATESTTRNQWVANLHRNRNES